MALELESFRPDTADDLFAGLITEVTDVAAKSWARIRASVEAHLQALAVSVARTRIDFASGALSRKEASVVLRAAQTSFETTVPFVRYMTTALAQRVINAAIRVVGWAIYNLTGFNFFPGYVQTN